MAAQYNSHPLPAPPGQSQPQSSQQQQQQQSQAHQQQYPPSSSQQRPTHQKTRSRGFSFHSQKSAGSGGNNTAALLETHGEKEAKRLHSKADPTMAMNEAEPAAVAAQAKSTMGSLRSMQHKDNQGNVITDPDQANPTRWRHERPLDTIRGFEKSIESSYRTSMIGGGGGDNESIASWNRNSYYANGNQGRYQHASYYGSSRPQSIAFRSDSYDQQPQGRWGGQPPPDRRRYNRDPESQYGQRGPGGAPYSAQMDHRSYETVASGSGTSGERPGYVTDPTSSDNSSIERRQSPPKRQQEAMNDYGIGFNQAPEYQPSAFSVNGGGGGGSQYAYDSAPPAVPRKDMASTLQRKSTSQEVSTPTSEKRRSWFKRLGQTA